MNFIIFSCLLLKLISIDLSLSWLILYSAFSNLMLSPSSQFFISVTVLFNCRISIVFKCLSLYWYFLCVVIFPFNSLNKAYFSSLNMFMICTLKYFTAESCFNTCSMGGFNYIQFPLL